MKEFNFLIDKAFISGQRTETIGARNRDLLVTTKNMRPTEYGLAANKAINDTLVTPPTTSWPYPQLFKGRGVTLLADEDAIYEVNESTGVLTELPAYPASSCATPDGTQRVANGGFASGTGWTLGTDWSISGGKLVANTVSGGAAAAQAEGDIISPFVIGGRFRCEFTIDSISAGSVRIQAGGVNSEYYTTAGTKSYDFTCTGLSGVSVVGISDLVASIDNLTITRIGEGTIPAGGGAWHFADFGGVWFLFKENCLVAKLPYYSDFQLMMVTSDDDLTCNTGENLGNRLFLGGITATPLLATTDFSDAWNAWVENSSDWSDEMTYADIQLATNIVMYSTRVGGDVYWPFIFEMALLGLPYRSSASVVADLKANYIDWIRKGEIGFVPLQHAGDIQCLKRLGNTIVAYCTDGVSIISAREGRGFRAKPIHHAGIASRSAVSGDDSKHVFLDSNNVLWGITPDGAINRMVGKGTFDAMVTAEASSPIVGTYDPEEQEHYICSGTQGFIHTRTGLGKITILPTSLIVTPTGLEGIVVDLATPDIEVETETFDMGMRALKTIHSIAIGFSDITNLQVVVKYKYDDTNTWRTSPAFDVNADSIAVPLFTAKDFRLVFTGTPGSDAKIDYVDVAYQVSDKRNIRRAYE